MMRSWHHPPGRQAGPPPSFDHIMCRRESTARHPSMTNRIMEAMMHPLGGLGVVCWRGPGGGCLMKLLQLGRRIRPPRPMSSPSFASPHKTVTTTLSPGFMLPIRRKPCRSWRLQTATCREHPCDLSKVLSQNPERKGKDHRQQFKTLLDRMYPMHLQMITTRTPGNAGEIQIRPCTACPRVLWWGSRRNRHCDRSNHSHAFSLSPGYLSCYIQYGSLFGTCLPGCPVPDTGQWHHERTSTPSASLVSSKTNQLMPAAGASLQRFVPAP